MTDTQRFDAEAYLRERAENPKRFYGQGISGGHGSGSGFYHRDKDGKFASKGSGGATSQVKYASPSKAEIQKRIDDYNKNGEPQGQFKQKNDMAGQDDGYAPKKSGQSERQKLDAMHDHFSKRRNDVYDAARGVQGYSQAENDRRAELSGKHQAYVHASDATQGNYVGGMASVQDALQRGHDRAKNSAERFQTPTDRGRHKGYQEVLAHFHKSK